MSLVIIKICIKNITIIIYFEKQHKLCPLKILYSQNFEEIRRSLIKILPELMCYPTFHTSNP